MKKNTAIKLLIILAVLGSVVTFYATNLILSDVSNMFYSEVTRDVVSSIPCFAATLDFILATIYVIRFYSKRRFVRNQTILYSNILAVFSVIGMLASLYSGFVIYGSMFAAYPFKCASLIFFVFHLAMFIHSFWTRKKGMAMTEGLEKRKYHIGYIVYTIMLCGMVFFAYNRFGAFLLSPLYISWRSFDLTFPFYLALLLPMAILVQMAFYVFKIIDRHPNGAIIHIVIVIVLNIVLGAMVMYRGYHNPLFISAVSPALAIERLLTKPIDTVFHHAFVFIFAFYELAHALVYRKKHATK